MESVDARGILGSPRVLLAYAWKVFLAVFLWIVDVRSTENTWV